MWSINSSLKSNQSVTIVIDGGDQLLEGRFKIPRYGHTDTTELVSSLATSVTMQRAVDDVAIMARRMQRQLSLQFRA